MTAGTAWTCAVQAAVIDVVREVVGGGLGVDAERGRDQLGVGAGGQAGQAGAAQQPGCDPGRAQQVAGVVLRRRDPGGLGFPGDQQVRVGGAQFPVVGQAPFDGGPGGRVQRDRVGPAAKPDAAGGRVDVAGGQAAEFFAAGAVDEGEQPGQRLMRVDALAGPAAEQAPLEFQQGGGALVAAGLAGASPRSS